MGLEPLAECGQQQPVQRHAIAAHDHQRGHRHADGYRDDQIGDCRKERAGGEPPAVEHQAVTAMTATWRAVKPARMVSSRSTSAGMRTLY
ncbi:hypothetical protein BJF85_04775 [Saccharomonospora sp. CUA-673]|nr:hypothetical protein BJF85_04775 [Saccharomonospora sp. CUA-673]